MIFIKILELTSDIVFKSFMLSEATRKYKAKLINSITGIPINLLEHAIYTSQELRNNHAKEKVLKTDILVSIKTHIISIEMNKFLYDKLRNKNAFYSHHLVSSQLEIGDSYFDYKKIIQINLDVKNNYKNAFSEFEMLNKKTGEQENDLITTYHIDLSRISTYNDIETKFFKIFDKNLDAIKGVDSDMDDAINELKRISSDEHIIGLYDKEKVEEKLRNTELICAKNEGIEKGKNEEKVASIKRMKAKGLDDETICDFLGINLDEMKKLLKIQ